MKGEIDSTSCFLVEKGQDSGRAHGPGIIAVAVLKDAICHCLPLPEMITLFMTTLITISISINVDQTARGIWSQEEKYQPEPKPWVKNSMG